MAGNRTFSVTVRVKQDGTEEFVRASGKASKAVEQQSTRFDRLKKNLAALKPSFLATTAAFVALGAALKNGIQDVFEYDRQIRRLSSAFGDIQGANVTGELEEQAAALSVLTGATDTAVLSAQALIAQFGATPEQTRKLTEASVELSAALGIGLEEAAARVAKTLGGFAGELGEAIPAIKELTAEELKAGAAADVLLAKFEGTAAATRNAETAFKNLGNAVSDYVRSTVSGISQTEALGDELDGLAKSIRDSQNEIPDLIRGFTQWKEEVQEINPALNALFATLEGLSTKLGLDVRIISSIATAYEEWGTALRELDNLEQSVEAGRERRENDRLQALSDETDAFFRARDAQEFWQKALEDASTSLGEQAEAAEESAKSTDATGEKAEEAADEFGVYAEVIEDTGDTLNAFTTIQERFRTSLQQTSQQLIITRQDFVEYERQFGRAAAEQAAIESGAVVENGRLRLPGGGRRLIRGGGGGLFPGLSGATYSYTIRRSQPTEDGGVTFT